MAVTPRHGTRSQPPPPPGLGLGQMVRLGVLGLASDIRDRGRDPALRKRPTARALDPRLHRPIFIIGAPRSGTTFLGSCLGRMPEVSYHFEPRLTKAAARCVYDGSWSERRCATVFRLSYSALLLAGLHGGRRFAEKNPENSFVVPFLAETMPEGQFIHIIRDGRDAAVSHAEQPWLNAKSAGSGQRGRGGQLWGNAARWWVEPDRRDEFAAVTDIVRSAWCWRRFTEAPLVDRSKCDTNRSCLTRCTRRTCFRGSSEPRRPAWTRCGPDWPGRDRTQWEGGATPLTNGRSTMSSGKSGPCSPGSGTPDGARARLRRRPARRVLYAGLA